MSSSQFCSLAFFALIIKLTSPLKLGVYAELFELLAMVMYIILHVSFDMEFALNFREVTQKCPKLASHDHPI